MDVKQNKLDVLFNGIGTPSLMDTDIMDDVVSMPVPTGNRTNVPADISKDVSTENRTTAHAMEQEITSKVPRKSRAVDSGGILRQPRTVMIRAGYWTKLRMKAIRTDREIWQIVDEALGDYLNKGKDKTTADE